MAQQSTVGKTATTISTEKGITSVVYHWTPVVKFSEKRITLNTGGWRTVTTKTRMNQTSSQFGLGYYVYQKAGDWFVEFQGKIRSFDNRTITLNRN